jgi:hypothetical protein
LNSTKKTKSKKVTSTIPVKSQNQARCKKTPILQPPTPSHPIPFHHTALPDYTSAFKNYACTGYFLGLPLFLGPGIPIAFPATPVALPPETFTTLSLLSTPTLTGVAAAPLPLTPPPLRPPPLPFLSSTFAAT